METKNENTENIEIDLDKISDGCLPNAIYGTMLFFILILGYIFK